MKVTLTGMLALLLLLGLAVSPVTTRAGLMVEETAVIDLFPTEAAPGASGVAELSLRINPQIGRLLTAVATVQGLTPDVRFSLCLDGVFVDDEDPDDTGLVVLDEDLEDEDVIFDTLQGITVTVRHGIGCEGTIVLSN